MVLLCQSSFSCYLCGGIFPLFCLSGGHCTGTLCRLAPVYTCEDNSSLDCEAHTQTKGVPWVGLLLWSLHCLLSTGFSLVSTLLAYVGIPTFIPLRDTQKIVLNIQTFSIYAGTTGASSQLQRTGRARGAENLSLYTHLTLPTTPYV